MALAGILGNEHESLLRIQGDLKSRGMGMLSWRTEDNDDLCMDVRALWITSQGTIYSLEISEMTSGARRMYGCIYSR
jgi:hypothetical protein